MMVDEIEKTNQENNKTQKKKAIKIIRTKFNKNKLNERNA
jgi:hypothetical protein